MKIKRIDHVGTRVMDLERTIRFYALLGFTVDRRDPSEHIAVLMHPNGCEINLLDSGTDNNNEANILMDVEPNYPGYTHYAFEVENVAAAKTKLESHGINITEGPVTFGDGKTSIFVRDPDRNVIEFTQLP